MSDEVLLEGPAFYQKGDDWKECNCKLLATGSLVIEKGKEANLQLDIQPCAPRLSRGLLSN